MILALIENQNTISASIPTQVTAAHVPLDNNEQCLSFLFDVVVKSHGMESCNQAINMMLDAGKQRFGFDYALVTRPVSETVYEVQAFSCGGEGRFYVGQHISTAEFLCHRVNESEPVREVVNVAETGHMVSPLAYGGLTVKSYAGVAFMPQFAPQGVLSFFSSESRADELGADDRKVLEQLASGIAFLSDQQKTQAQRKSVDSSMFANGSISTLDEYLEQARLPELYGIPGRVVEVLTRRIGVSPLSIGHVAEELNLSKRTLQRRLQQQSVNFADLRDQVRYHYSIDYLVKNRKSIDSISVALDFSDRTSFTNAFKRWTGMSPSTFRKLFRDFV